MKNLVLLAGTRPNFIKIAPLNAALVQRGILTFLVHTGQHYDRRMSDVFFKELEIPDPDVHLDIGSGDRLTQTKKIIAALVPILLNRKPDAIIVVGDVTSTSAGVIAGVIAGIPVLHVEAGLRSFNWNMPEELNRMIADHYSSHLFISDPSGIQNLLNEAIPGNRFNLVGNVMIDTLRKAESKAAESKILTQLDIKPGGYGLLTLHRPENVDNPHVFRDLWKILCEASQKIPFIFPVHPRTQGKMGEFGIKESEKIRIIEPVGYLDMIALTKSAMFALTDSGGVQEETTALGIPCLTLREQTERPVTVTEGTSEILGRDREKILTAVDKVMRGEWKKGTLPAHWDGHASERIAEIIEKL